MSPGAIFGCMNHFEGSRKGSALYLIPQMGWPKSLNRPVLHASLIRAVSNSHRFHTAAQGFQGLQLEATKPRMATLRDPSIVFLLLHTGQAGHQGQPDSRGELITRLQFS